jgi:hypothetical protein
VPARVVDAYDQMMRQVIGPALRQLGFTGTLREFRYGSRSQSGVVAWQKDGREVRRQVLSFTANVNYWCGEDRIGSLMPVPAPDTWWQITGGQCYEPVAASVITAVRRYALPAIQAGLEDPGRHDADMRYTRASGPGGPDGGGAATTSWFVRPAGTAHDEAFGWLASADPSERLAAAEIATSEAPGDPRTPAALVDRLSQDPNPMVRKLIASRMLPLLTSHPEVISALQAAAAGDTHTGAGQIARHFRLGRSKFGRCPGDPPRYQAVASTSWAGHARPPNGRSGRRSPQLDVRRADGIGQGLGGQGRGSHRPVRPRRKDHLAEPALTTLGTRLPLSLSVNLLPEGYARRRL